MSAKFGPAGARTIAVIGSGVAGLTAAHVLAAYDRVTLYEADGRFGGHAHTQFVDAGHGEPTAVDTAFLVHNDRTYPTLCRLFNDLGIRTTNTDMSMSMSVRDDRIGLEYAGARGVCGLFASPAAASPRYLWMLVEIKRFHRRARRLLAAPEANALSLGDFVRQVGFSQFFVDHFLTPLVAAVWSCPPGQAMAYPAQYLFRFLDHHGMLSVFGSPQWKTVTGGSRTYVDAVVHGLHEAFTDAPIVQIRRDREGVAVTAAGHAPRVFDAAVIATHPDQALGLLAQPTDDERAVLGAIDYVSNSAQLHTDESLLPRRAHARASWNYLSRGGSQDVVVTYDITRLMSLSGPHRFLVTLGGEHLVRPGAVLAEMTYRHPVYTSQSVAAQRRLPSLNDGRIAFAGAYHGWGFHEDGAASGLRAAQALGRGWPASTAGQREHRVAAL
ncbi:NAD(P)/FAD-dependent oxidoreductase [Mycobacteroides abscessus]|uniref:NAD(P)/FAD-dependent oxidoreductase n=1 Tax=Mycobacteroides abscessus TaxID=36809 RepID=UPI0002D2F242|nr:FAD-dependent oxidoreductase [Mycobacteroides abscessus]ANO00892.1 amine oxidase [Mycobacteroides abscessus]MBN7320270.1 FAD-dependent oxidoreductase [Mycobacteroides abscessus subsp. massiliense]